MQRLPPHSEVPGALAAGARPAFGDQPEMIADDLVGLADLVLAR